MTDPNFIILYVDNASASADFYAGLLAQLSLFAVPERATSLIFKDFDLKGLHYGRRLA